ncbi:MipA/OmpV family protein [Kordiimonas aquimaris]|uniref:MipA/OmpV family protein n=1 Tax=Kordiimonas aquimaris TaxID=707591 RepID=UPI0021D13E30|nr:MipA/OmpV family protein [Kordiimonas aquimaris]
MGYWFFEKIANKTQFYLMTVRRLLNIFAIAITMLLTAAPAAHAQFNIGDRFDAAVEFMQQGIDLIWPGDLRESGFNTKLGIGIGLTPDYIGSDNYRLRVIPIIDIRYKERWRLNGSLLTYAALKNGPFEAGPLLNLRFGRPESRNRILRGLREIDTTFEVGAFARYQTKSGLVSIDYRHATSEDLGGSVRFTAGHGFYKTGNFVAIAGVRGRWLTRKSTQRQFGVTAQDAEQSEAGLPVFTASSGFSELSGNLVGAYRLNERVRVLSLVSVGRLFGDAKDSPLVSGATGSPTQFIVGFGITRQF